MPAAWRAECPRASRSAPDGLVQVSGRWASGHRLQGKPESALRIAALKPDASLKRSTASTLEDLTAAQSTGRPAFWSGVGIATVFLALFLLPFLSPDPCQESPVTDFAALGLLRMRSRPSPRSGQWSNSELDHYPFAVLPGYADTRGRSLSEGQRRDRANRRETAGLETPSSPGCARVRQIWVGRNSQASVGQAIPWVSSRLPSKGLCSCRRPQPESGIGT